MIEAIILAVSPIIVTGLTNITKKIKAIDLSGEYKKSIVRFLVGLFSFLAVVASSLLTGEDVDVTSIQTASEVIVTFLAATGVYFFAKK